MFRTRVPLHKLFHWCAANNTFLFGYVVKTPPDFDSNLHPSPLQAKESAGGTFYSVTHWDL